MESTSRRSTRLQLDTHDLTNPIDAMPPGALANTTREVRDVGKPAEDPTAPYRQGSTDELLYQKNIFFNKNQGGRPRMQVVRDQNEEEQQSSQSEQQQSQRPTNTRTE